MYAIRNIITGKFLYGTDYRYNPPHQRTSFKEMKTYESLAKAKSDLKHRRCNSNYQIVEVNVKVTAIVNMIDEK
ncbi:MAG: hypothetical protein MJZ03_06295 [archaeon]|nr:hypothetical protein [archaeon]